MYIYLLIEIEKRELVSKSILAAKLYNAGYSVIIGQQWEIFKQLENIPLGIILFKGYHKIFHSAIIRAKELGHIVLLHDEELFLQFPEKSFINSLDTKIINSYDAILTSGKAEYDFLENLGFERLIKFGNPRSELLGEFGHKLYDNQIKDIKDKYRDFILINTNFGITNSLWGNEETVKSAGIQAGYVNENNIELEKLWNENIKNEDYCWNLIEDLILKLKNLQFIIRPHPAESLDRWIKKYIDYDNVKIIREGNHVPWTQACQILIQSNCATGIEAAIMGKNVITIGTQESNEYVDNLSSNYFTEILSNSKDVIEKINLILKSDSDLSNFKPDNKLLWENKQSSSDLFIKIINNFANRSFDQKYIFPKLKFTESVKQLEAKCNIKVDDLNNIVKKINEVNLIKKKINIKEIGKSLFLLENDAKENYTRKIETIAELKLNLKKGLINQVLNDLNNLMKLYPFDYDITLLRANLYLKIESNENSINDFLLAKAINPLSIEPVTGLIKASYKIKPEIAISEFYQYEKANENNYFKLANFYNEIIEFYTFANLVKSGLDPYHIQNNNELGFSFIKNKINKFFEITKKLWLEKENRNSKLFEILVNSTFSAKDFDSLRQFLPILRQKFPSSIWASIWHFKDNPEFYSSKKFINKREYINLNINFQNQDIYNHNIVCVSSDFKYFVKNTVSLLKSLNFTNYKAVAVIHLIGNKEECMSAQEILNKIEFKFYVELLFEDYNLKNNNNENIIYYHLARFFALDFLLNKYKTKILLLDADTLVRNSLNSIFNQIINYDILIRGRPGRLNVWNQLNASAICFNYTKNALKYLNYVCGYLECNLNNESARWGSDQVSLYLIYIFFKNNNIILNIEFLNSKIVDYDITDDGILWQNSGSFKHFNRNNYKSILPLKSNLNRYNEYFDTVTNQK
jgi:surface carbohydrate biosynthesis protein